MAHIEATPRISTSVLNAYIRKKIEPVFHRSVLLSMMKSKGLITYKNDGKEIVWFPRFRRRDIVAGMGNPVSISFPQTATNKEARLPWRQYQMGESVTKFERLVGRSVDREHGVPAGVGVVRGHGVDEWNAHWSPEGQRRFPARLLGVGADELILRRRQDILAGLPRSPHARPLQRPTAGRFQFR